MYALNFFENYNPNLTYFQPSVEDPDTGTGQNVYGLLEGALYDANSYTIDPQTFQVGT